MNLEEKVNSINTKYEEGFTKVEIESLLKDFPNINKEKFDDALYVVTGPVIEGEFVIYRWDIVKALRCGIENRDLYFSEWD